MAHLQHYYFEYFAVVGHELVYNSVCEHVMCHSMFVNTVKRLRVLKSSELSALCREFFDPHSLIPHVNLSTTLRSVLKFLCLLFSVGSSKQEKAPLDSALK